MSLNNSQRAALAKQILDNKAFQEAFDILKNTYINAMIKTKTEDSKSRDLLHMRLMCLGDLMGHLTQCISRGRLDEENAAQREKVRTENASTTAAPESEQSTAVLRRKAAAAAKRRAERTGGSST